MVEQWIEDLVRQVFEARIGAGVGAEAFELREQRAGAEHARERSAVAYFRLQLALHHRSNIEAGPLLSSRRLHDDVGCRGKERERQQLSLIEALHQALDVG